jgi:hypothetical protein
LDRRREEAELAAAAAAEVRSIGEEAASPLSPRPRRADIASSVAAVVAELGGGTRSDADANEGKEGKEEAAGNEDGKLLAANSDGT